jgi:GTP pyrophosphokinase
VPYLSHLLSVCSIVLDHGGHEDEAIAALLHDAIEDTEHDADDIERRFGARVTEIVVACTDADPPRGAPKPAWKPRKDAYLSHLRAIDDAGILLVAAADKYSNLSAIVRDADAGERGLWNRFKGGLGGTAWYYQRLDEILGPRLAAPVLAGLLSAQRVRLDAIVDAVRSAHDPLAGNIESALRDVNPVRWTDDEADDSAPWLALELAYRSDLADPIDPRPGGDLSGVAVSVLHRWFGDGWDADDLPVIAAAMRQ